MINFFTSVWGSFIAGLIAPLGAVCVLPIYPGFLSFLSAQLEGDENKKSKIIRLGWAVTFGVIASMAVIGFIFSFLLSSSLTSAIGVISPIAFGILGLVSLFLIFDFDFSRFLPHVDSPTFKNPMYSAFAFGAFFGLIVLPCNPASLVLLFAIITTVTSFATNFVNFIFFGIGMAAPLLAFSYLSSSKSSEILGFLGRNKRRINLVSGLLMLTVSLYYLIKVFKILEVFGI